MGVTINSIDYVFYCDGGAALEVTQSLTPPPPPPPRDQKLETSIFHPILVRFDTNLKSR